MHWPPWELIHLFSSFFSQPSRPAVLEPRSVSSGKRRWLTSSLGEACVNGPEPVSPGGKSWKGQDPRHDWRPEGNITTRVSWRKTLPLPAACGCKLGKMWRVRDGPGVAEPSRESLNKYKGSESPWWSPSWCLLFGLALFWEREQSTGRARYGAPSVPMWAAMSESSSTCTRAVWLIGGSLSTNTYLHFPPAYSVYFLKGNPSFRHSIIIPFGAWFLYIWHTYALVMQLYLSAVHACSLTPSWSMLNVFILNY